VKRCSLWGIFVLLAACCGSGTTAVPGLRLWDAETHQEIGIQQAAARLAGASLVFVGETHDLPSHHQGQLQVIETLAATGKPLAVGLEMFQQRHQEVLDRWGAGKIDEKEFVPHFRANWGDHWPLYRDIFLTCRSRQIPMVGLNVPKEITRQVARNGFDSLSREQIGMLPMVTCQVDPEYLELMHSAHGHGGMSPQAFTNFCEAQLVWDTAMAIHSLDYLRKNPERTLIVLAGSVHAWKKGIPAQVRKHDPKVKQLVMLPSAPEAFNQANSSPADCDYLLLGL
jgi:uncharacterized iron-regulated protein